jgi:hypothetical protein
MFKRSTPLNEIENLFNAENYQVDDIQIKNNTRLYVNYICPNNHIGEIRLDCFKTGRRCKECYKNKNYYTYEQIVTLFQSEDYQILDNSYKNARTHINFICKSGHQGKILLTHWLKGHRCRYCGYEISAEKNKSKNPDRELYNLTSKLSHSLRNQLKRLGQNIKIGEKEILFDKLGYTQEDFLNHIKNHPNYENACKNNNLSIDHIFPIKAFKDYGLLDLKYNSIINSLDNLQPLDKNENSSKNCKYNKDEFLSYLKLKDINLN